MQLSLLHPPLHQFPLCFPRAPKRGGDGNPVSIRPVTPSHALHVVTFNARRLWLQDEATHDGFPMLSRILLSENVGVCCIQETNAGDFTTLPVDQPCTYDGPCGSQGREAAFLMEGVVSTPIPGVLDSVSMRWRTFGESVCVCSFHAPHPGIDANVHVVFWQKLTATVRHARSTVDLPMVIAGDANVWLPHFSLGRSRSVDNLVVPFIDLLISSCGLRLINPPDQATHVAGAAQPYVDLIPLPLFDVGPLRNWSSTPLRASKAPLPIAPHSVLMLCMTSCSLCCRGMLHARAWFLVVVSLLWYGFLMLVSGAACGPSCAISCMARTQSQVRCGSSLSEPWVDSGIAQGRVLSPLLFNLLINSLIASVQHVAPGVQFCSSSFRVPGQLYVDDLELSAQCEFDLQVALDAVARWGRQWRFSFGIGPTKSAVMVVWPKAFHPSLFCPLGR